MHQKDANNAEGLAKCRLCEVGTDVIAYTMKSRRREIRIYTKDITKLRHMLTRCLLESIATAQVFKVLPAFMEA
jgi:hypothetical protein